MLLRRASCARRIAHARVVSIDLAAAQKAPGVKAALAVLEPGKKAMYQGDEVAAVAAATEEQARDALRLIKVQYEVLPHIAHRVDARCSPARRRSSRAATSRKANAEESGDLDAGFKAAAHIVEATYATQVQTHVCLETHGRVCEWDGDKLTAWVSTQAVHGSARGLRGGAADPAGERARDLRVHGRRLRQQVRPDAQGVICAKLAKQAGAPVKLMLDRKEEHLAGGNRPSSFLEDQGRRRRRRHADGVRRASRGARAARASARASRCRTSTRSRTGAARHKDVYTNAGPARAMRAPGHPQGCFAHRAADGRARRQGPHGPGRVPHEEPAGRSAERDVAAVLPDSRREDSAGTSGHPTGDPTPGPIKRGMGMRRQPVGRRRARHEGALSRSCRTAAWSCAAARRISAPATRTLVAMVAAETLGLPIYGDQGGDRRQRLSRSAAAAAAARRSASVTPAIRVTAGQGVRRPRRARGADDRRAAGGPRRRRPGASSRRTPRRRGSRGRTRAACSAPSRCRSTASGKPGCRRAARAACSSPRSKWTSRPA